MPTFKTVLLISLLSATSAAAQGAAGLDVPIEVTAPNGFHMAAPDAAQTSAGARFKGSVCRRSHLQSPARIRLERVDAAGQVTASASRALSGLGRQAGHCAHYTVTTDWRLAQGERIRVCAPRSGATCAKAS